MGKFYLLLKLIINMILLNYPTNVECLMFKSTIERKDNNNLYLNIFHLNQA
ncbi:hypothetical protein C3B55_00729 [Candidatus Pseudomonas adelgestsugas]|uniref:Uncharacterized protein n=1 Tax=Candidatus Pseudomonas adelgestsugas TaxID=1302376 RepID=A0ABX5RA87_9PSED|nr:hypothetical protein C3B55_00729 [Candidatus Pseudomonas adelgestsugas]